jgi:hypothetical protein
MLAPEIRTVLFFRPVFFRFVMTKSLRSALTKP